MASQFSNIRKENLAMMASAKSHGDPLVMAGTLVVLKETEGAGNASHTAWDATKLNALSPAEKATLLSRSGRMMRQLLSASTQTTMGLAGSVSSRVGTHCGPRVRAVSDGRGTGVHPPRTRQ